MEKFETVYQNEKECKATLSDTYTIEFFNSERIYELYHRWIPCS